MSKVRIVTDSDASIPADVLDKYSIEVIPQVLRVGRDRFEDSQDFNADRLFQLIRENQSGGRILLPEVEAPELSRLMEVYCFFYFLLTLRRIYRAKYLNFTI